MARQQMSLEIDDDITRKIIENFVKPVVQEILLSHIQEDIYAAYEPTRYDRAYSLLDPANLETEIEGYTLYMTSNAQPHIVWVPGAWSDQTGGFLALHNIGNMGIWGYFPRRALSLAQEELDTSKKISEAVQKGFEFYMKSR